MKKFLPALLWMILLAPLSVLHAQDVTGTWQGMMQTPAAELRTVIKISKSDSGALQAILYSIDRSGGQGLPGTVTVQGSTVKMTMPGVGGSYDGKLSADGLIITGTWTQGPMPLALNLTRVTADTAWAIPPPPSRATPMAADANPTFEVATIKPSIPGSPGIAHRVNGRRFSTLNTPLSDLITFAYDLHPKQISGGPAWMDSEKYDLAAEPDGEGQPNTAQWKTMLQKLLADRFQLAFHREKKELPVYTIVVGKTGAKITRNETNPGGLPGLFFSAPGVLNVTNATIADFANLMQSIVLDRPVIDQTALPGRYDFALKWTPDESQFGGGSFGKIPPPAADNTAAAPDLFTAMQEQLGLKLTATRAPADVLVIDRVEKPSAN